MEKFFPAVCRRHASAGSDGWLVAEPKRRPSRVSRALGQRCRSAASDPALHRYTMVGAASITRIDFHLPERNRRVKQNAMAMMYAVANAQAHRILPP